MVLRNSRRDDASQSRVWVCQVSNVRGRGECDCEHEREGYA